VSDHCRTISDFGRFRTKKSPGLIAELHATPQHCEGGSAQQLLEEGVEVNASIDSDNSTALIYAAAAGLDDVVKLLLESLCYIN
jgi:ankyrin repeat protein